MQNSFLKYHPPIRLFPRLHTTFRVKGGNGFWFYLPWCSTCKELFPGVPVGDGWLVCESVVVCEGVPVGEERFGCMSVVVYEGVRVGDGRFVCEKM